MGKVIACKANYKKRFTKKLFKMNIDHIKNIYGKNMQFIIEQAMESLTKNSEDLKVSKTTVYAFMASDCNLSIKRGAFHSKKNKIIRMMHIILSFI